MVIGGAGFIGSHLVDTLIENKNKVIVFDDFSRGSRKYLSSSQKLIVEKGSILEKDKLASIIK